MHLHLYYYQSLVHLETVETNDVYVEKTKVLIPSGIGCIIIMVPAIFITYFAPIADVLLLFRIPPTNTPNYNYLIDILIPRIMLVIVLILYIAGSFLPTNIEDYFLTKKYGSIQNGEGAKLEAIAKATNQPLNVVIFNTLEQTKRWKLNDWEKNVLGRDELTDTEIQKIIAKETSIKNYFLLFSKMVCLKSNHFFSFNISISYE